MFSFSKVLACSLGALSSVRAVPFMQTSYSVDLGTSVGPAHVFNVLEPGVYRIVNVATNTPVAASVQNGQIYWKLEKSDQGRFKITNIALGTSIFSEKGEFLLYDDLQTFPTEQCHRAYSFVAGSQPAETFTVESAGSGEFILTYSFKIKEVAADEEWTLAPVPDSPFGTLRLSSSHGQKEQFWRLIPV
ncbi:hypothetical protein K438DRAFT_1759190 [Mycena galopus ATCC 62051]|nr:hypothetical protein K438DRAFT_1759190 [Mycena galopus ATCC 62051]